MARQRIGECDRTYKKVFEPSWGYFAGSALATLAGLAGTVALYTQADSNWPWIALGILTLLVGAVAVLGLIANLGGRKLENRLRFCENGFVHEDLRAKTTEEVFWDEVAAISYQNEGVFAGITVRTQDDRTIKFCFAQKENNQIYQRLCKETRDRLVQEANTLLDEGEEVAFGPELKFDDETISSLIGKVRWEDVQKVEVYDVYVNDRLSRRDLRFQVKGAWLDRTINRDSMENLHVFLELARHRYQVDCRGSGKLG